MKSSVANGRQRKRPGVDPRGPVQFSAALVQLVKSSQLRFLAACSISTQMPRRVLRKPMASSAGAALVSKTLPGYLRKRTPLHRGACKSVKSDLKPNEGG
jgi:hypothetical protein